MALTIRPVRVSACAAGESGRRAPRDPLPVLAAISAAMPSRIRAIPKSNSRVGIIGVVQRARDDRAMQ